MRVTREEVPHAVAVEVESITERPGDSLVEIEAHLIVEHESQKAILIGKGGQRREGHRQRRARRDRDGARRPRLLSLRVKVRKHWRRDDRYVDHLL